MLQTYWQRTLQTNKELSYQKRIHPQDRVLQEQAHQHLTGKGRDANQPSSLPRVPLVTAALAGGQAWAPFHIEHSALQCFPSKVLTL